MRRVALVAGIILVVTVTIATTLYKQGEEKEKKFQFTHPALEHPEVAGRQVVRRIELEEPVKAFDFSLTNHDNSNVMLSDFRGSLVLIGFIYTNCPDVCGILTQHFYMIQRKFKDIIDKELTLVFISTDPERDTPERVQAYTKGFRGKWRFLTGSEEQLKEVWENYKVFVKPKKGVDLVYHTYMVALIDRQGYIRYRYIGLVDPADVISHDIRRLLEEGGV